MPCCEEMSNFSEINLDLVSILLDYLFCSYGICYFSASLLYLVLILPWSFCNYRTTLTQSQSQCVVQLGLLWSYQIHFGIHLAYFCQLFHSLVVILKKSWYLLKKIVFISLDPDLLKKIVFISLDPAYITPNVQ